MKKTFNFMNNIKKLLLAFAASLILAGCSNVISEDNSGLNADGTVNLTVSLSDGVTAARTALPGYTWSEYVYDLSYVYAKGTDKETSSTVVNKIDFSILTHTLKLLPGNYEFSLTGYITNGTGDSATYSKVIEGLCKIDVTKDTKILPFRMYASEGLKGNASVTGLFPGTAPVVSCKVCLKNSLMDAFAVTDDSSDLTAADIVSAGDSKSVSYTESGLDSAKTYFAVFKFYDSNEKSIYDHIESIYVMGGKTSTSTFTFDAGSYYLKTVSVTLTKDGEGWTGTTVILKDNDGNEYELTSAGDGTYTGSVPEGEYKVEIKDSTSGKETDTGVTVNTDDPAAEVSYKTVTLPSDGGVTLAPAENSTSENGANENSIKTSDNTYLVPDGKDLDVTVTTKPGYETKDTDGDVKISDKTVAADGSETVPVAAGTTVSADDIEGVSAIEYEITYDFTDTDGSWSGSFSPETKYTYTIESGADLVDSSNVAYKDDTMACAGWTITVADGGSTTLTGTVTKITAGSTYGAVTAKPVFVATGNVQYTVKYFYQNTDGSYTENTSQAETKTVKAGDPVTEKPKYDAETGFTKPADQDITATAGRVVSFYYNRNTIKLTLKAGDDGAFSDGKASHEVSGLYGAAVPAVTDLPSATGDKAGYYVFDSWSPELPSTFTEEGEYAAQYTQKYADYTINYYFQNLDDDDYVVEKTVTSKAEIGSTVTVSAADAALTGDDALKFNTAVITPATVTDDRSAEVKVEYARKTVTISLASNSGSWSDSEWTEGVSSKTKTGKVGATVGTLPGITRDDYEFQGYYNGDTKLEATSVFPTADVTYTAKWSQTGAPYEVQYYEENTAGTYDQITVTHTGKAEVGSTLALADITPAYTPAVSEGFTARADSITIQAETSVSKNILKVYYDRNTVTYTFKANGGNWSGSTADVTKSGKYGTSVGDITEPARDKYSFMGWVKSGESATSTVPSAYGTSDLTYTAMWYSQVEGEGDNPTAKDISLSYDEDKGTVSVTVPYTSDGWQYVWYIDHAEQSVTSKSIDVSGLTAGVHDITVVATENGLTFNKTYTLTVTNK